MNRFVVSLSGLCALTTAGYAADLPVRSAPPVFVTAPVFTWTGFYAGLNAGYAFSDDRVRTRASGAFTRVISAAITGLGADLASYESGGFTGGGQIGYNYQSAPGSGVVIGIEADAQYTDLNRPRSSTYKAPTFGFGSPAPPFNFLSIDSAFEARSRQSLDYLGTVRGRVGYAFDRVLFYGTGGFAFGQAEYSSALIDTQTNYTNNVPVASARFQTLTRSSKMQTGYVFGGGVEYALPTDSFLNIFQSSAVTLKVEYLHYDLGSRNVNGVVTPTFSTAFGESNTTISRVRTAGNFVRAGLNYKFASY